MMFQHTVGQGPRASGPSPRSSAPPGSGTARVTARHMISSEEHQILSDTIIVRRRRTVADALGVRETQLNGVNAAEPEPVELQQAIPPHSCKVESHAATRGSSFDKLKV